jgi:hypothetical protein
LKADTERRYWRRHGAAALEAALGGHMLDGADAGRGRAAAELTTVAGRTAAELTTVAGRAAELATVAGVAPSAFVAAYRNT